MQYDDSPRAERHAGGYTVSFLAIAMPLAHVRRTLSPHHCNTNKASAEGMAGRKSMRPRNLKNA
jgi:hypothetical protein